MANQCCDDDNIVEIRFPRVIVRPTGVTVDNWGPPLRYIYLPQSEEECRNIQNVSKKDGTFHIALAP
nr:unnamed protein product [Callosobruchus analis]